MIINKYLINNDAIQILDFYFAIINYLILKNIYFKYYIILNFIIK